MEKQEEIEEIDIEGNVSDSDLFNIDIDNLSDRKIGEKLEKPHLNGKLCVVSKIELKATNNEKTTKDGLKAYKPVMFRVYYDLVTSETYENYGGVAIFKHGNAWGEPTIWTEGNSAASKLFKLWLKHTGKKTEEVSYKDFFKGLVGMKVKLKERETMFDGKEYTKNVIEAFI